MILDFAVGMKDQVSRPSKDAAKAVLGVSTSMQATQAKAKSLDAELSKAREELTKLMAPSARGKELSAQLDGAKASLSSMMKPSAKRGDLEAQLKAAGDSVKAAMKPTDTQKQAKAIEDQFSKAMGNVSKISDAKERTEAAARAGREYADAMKQVRVEMAADAAKLVDVKAKFTGLEKELQTLKATEAEAITKQKDLITATQQALAAETASHAAAVDKQKGVIAGIRKDILQNEDAGKSAAETQSKALEQLQGKWEANAKASESFSEQLKSVGAVAGGVAAAIAAAAVALGGFVVSLAENAVSVSQAERQMTSMFEALGDGQISGQQTVTMLDDLSAHIGISRDELVPFTKQLLAMGITGEGALRGMTQAAISAQAIMGDAAAGDAFIQLQKKIRAAADSSTPLKLKLQSLDETGVNVNDVAKEMGISAAQLGKQLKAGTIDATKFGDALTKAVLAKGAGPLDALANSFGEIWKNAKKDFNDFFKGIDPVIQPFMGQVRGFFDIFKEGTPSANALKAGIGGGLTFVFQKLTLLVPMVKHFFLQMIVYALQAYIAMKPILKWFEDLKKNQKFMETMQRVLSAVGTALKVIGVAIGVAVVSAVAFGVALTAIQAAILALGALIMADVTKWIGIIIDWAKSGYTSAGDFVKGLSQGIINGAAAVGDAVKGLATKAKDTFKNMLGIHSPSTVGKQLGGYFGGGIAGGVTQAAPEVHKAAKALGTASIVGAGAGAAMAAPEAPQTSAPNFALARAASTGPTAPPPVAPTTAPAGGGGVTVNLAPGAIAVNAGAGGESLLELTETAVSLMFERVALAQGLG